MNNFYSILGKRSENFKYHKTKPENISDFRNSIHDSKMVLTYFLKIYIRYIFYCTKKNI